MQLESRSGATESRCQAEAPTFRLKSAQVLLKELSRNNGKIVGRFFATLVFNVLFYRLLIYFPYCSAEIPSSPHMLSPISFLKRWILILQYSR